jgi:hypothetical protein
MYWLILVRGKRQCYGLSARTTGDFQAFALKFQVRGVFCKWIYTVCCMLRGSEEAKYDEPAMGAVLATRSSVAWTAVGWTALRSLGASIHWLGLPFARKDL